MSERTGTGKGEDTAVAAAAKTGAQKGAAKPEARISRPSVYCPEPPRIKASAKEMAAYLERYADELRRIAEQLRSKGPNETVALPWPPCGTVVYCNGGGNGGGGGE